MDQKVSENELIAKSDEDQHESVCRENSDVDNALLFFHFMGMLFYYHGVKEMRDFVFTDCQWLFDKLTELVTKSYSKKDVCAEDVEAFTKKGRLNINFIENLKVDLQGIQPLYFIRLLAYLNIVAPIDLKLNEYFMPCVLPSYPLKNPSQKCINLDEFYGAIQHKPLLVGFKNGPMPHGFFCHLIVELFKNTPTGWCLPLRSKEEIQHVFNNLITFPTTSGHAMSLFYKIGYLEIQVRCRRRSAIIIHYNVKCELDIALRNASCHLHLSNEQLCYGFYCECKEKHFARLKKSSDLCIFCTYDYFEMTDDHLVWLQVLFYIMISYAIISMYWVK